jgi:hypothetical protein
MIIGPPDGSGNYINSNSSVNDGHFSPFINGVGTFVLNDSIITSGTDLSHTAVSFLFGTGPDFSKPGTLIITPLPAALPFFATGLGALGLLSWRRKRKNLAPIAA